MNGFADVFVRYLLLFACLGLIVSCKKNAETDSPKLLKK